MKPVRCRIRWLQDGEAPASDELALGLERFSYKASYGGLTITRHLPIVHKVFEIQLNGDIPGKVALSQLDSEVTSALVVLLGHNLPYDLCLAAMYCARHEDPDFMRGSRWHKILLAHEGFIADAIDRYESAATILREAVRFWTQVQHEPDQVDHYASIWRQFEAKSYLGVESVEEIGNVCLVCATGYGYAFGFKCSDTVVLMKMDEEETSTQISIATIAEDASFMRKLHEELCYTELSFLATQGTDLHPGHRWQLSGDNYLEMPKYGTQLDVELIVDIINRFAPPTDPSLVIPE